MSEARYIPRFSKNTHLFSLSREITVSDRGNDHTWILFIRRIYHKMDELAFHSFMIIACIFPLMSKIIDKKHIAHFATFCYNNDIILKIIYKCFC